MGHESNFKGSMAEHRLSSELSDPDTDLARAFSAMVGQRIASALVIKDKMIKPDLSIQLESGKTAWLSAKSAQASQGSCGHAGRLTESDAVRLGAHPDAEFALKLIRTQEYSFASRQSHERALDGASLVPARALARLAMVGELSPAPEIVIIFLDGPNARALFGPIDDLLDKAPVQGVVLRPPKLNDHYASAGFGDGLFSIKRSGGDSQDLQLTFSTAAAAKLFDSGSLSGWSQARVGNGAPRAPRS